MYKDIAPEEVYNWKMKKKVTYKVVYDTDYSMLVQG